MTFVFDEEVVEGAEVAETEEATEEATEEETPAAE